METFTVKNLAIRTWLGNMEANLLRHSLESKLIEHKICDKMRGGVLLQKDKGHLAIFPAA